MGEEEQGRANRIMMYMNETTMKSLYILTKIVFKRQGWFIIPFLSPNCSLHPGNSLVFINDEQQQILFLKKMYMNLCRLSARVQEVLDPVQLQS